MVACRERVVRQIGAEFAQVFAAANFAWHRPVSSHRSALNDRRIGFRQPLQAVQTDRTAARKWRNDVNLGIFFWLNYTDGQT
ncbi:hypothetical protein CEE69_01890 [Rhodopirellula bahusiensis]|uniref:Uncharacterized protein n=1 Tax=Rhodopirellula bahusiensis TaxID=2014065 RepID=A0A2G1WEE9_9BACT|nr:hypothetical protein CEE69_01890 [Rhodopirellula bahusiensis]